MLSTYSADLINKTFDYAGFEPETHTSVTVETDPDEELRQTWFATISNQKHRIDDLEDRLKLAAFHTPTINERRAYAIIKKLESMPYRLRKMLHPDGDQYMESSEINKFMMHEIMPEELRYSKNIKNHRRDTLDLMRLICNTFPDNFKMKQEGNKKKVWVIIVIDLDDY